MNRAMLRTMVWPAILGALLFPLVAGAATITFEEPIPQPYDVQMQYATVPAYDVGVIFPGGGRIFTPSVATSSPTKALYNDLGTEFDETRKLPIRFTASQKSVSMKVGLHRAYSFDVTAFLTVYSGDEPGAPGTTIVGTTAPLGKGPCPITTTLSVTAPSATIRSAMIEFRGAAAGKFAFEVIDDLTIDTAGSGTVTDTTAPTVTITDPAADVPLTYDPMISLAYTATDKETGIAAIQVAFLDENGKELESFDSCGGPGGPPCAHDASPLSSSGNYWTFLAEGTASIRVEAWDYAGHTGQATRKVHYDPPPATTNIWALAMEITQATQPWVATSTTTRSHLEPYIGVDQTSVPFVAGKRTVVRVYPGIEGSGGIALVGARARLECVDHSTGAPCPGPKTIDPDSTISIDPAHANAVATLRADASRTWNFVLPEAWTTTDKKVWLRATVLPPPKVSECLGCDDGANSINVQGIDFQRVAPVDIQLMWARVRRRATDPVGSGDTLPLTIHQDIFQSADSFFLKTYPVPASDFDVTIRSPQIIDIDGQFNSPFDQPGPMLGAMTSDRMKALRGLVVDMAKAASPPPPYNQVFLALVPPPVTAVAGIGGRNAVVAAITPAAASAGDTQIVAHEMGHAYGRTHASCDHGEKDGGGCEPAPAVFPCNHGGICTFGFDTIEMRVIDPGDTTGVGAHVHDFMSYGGAPEWVSPYTYTGIFDALHATLTSGKEEMDPRPKEDGEAFWLRGIVTETPAVAGTLLPAYHLFQTDIPLDEGEGAYRVELRDAAGRVLFARAFDVELFAGDPPDPADPPAGGFFEIVPYAPDTARIVLLRDQAILSELLRSPSPPETAIILPAAGEVWAEEGGHEVIWRATDADDPDAQHLFHIVQYSCDNGATWGTIASDTSAMALVLDAAGLAGTETARIRVLTTDGIDTAIDVSGRFAVKKKPPQAWIISPTAGDGLFPSFREHDLVVLEGGGTDIEDGPLGDESFSWWSHRDGQLGAGHRIDVRSLSPGVHEITLEARDSDGEIGTTVLPVEIIAMRNAQPIADAGPDRIAVPGVPIRLDGTRSTDLDGDPLTYLWTIESAPAGSHPILSDPRADQPLFSVEEDGTYVVRLVLHDGEVGSIPDTGTIIVAESPYRLRFEPATGCRGGPVRTSVLLTNPEPVQGCSIGIGFDASALALEALSIDDTDASGADYFQPYIDDRAGWATAGVILATGASPRAIAAGIDRPILDVHFAIACAAGPDASLRFEDGHVVNELPVRNELTVGGAEVIPRRDDGAIVIVDPPRPTVTATCESGHVRICWDAAPCAGTAARVQILRDGSAVADLSEDPGCHVDAPCGGVQEARGFSYEVRLTYACGKVVSGSVTVTCCGAGAIFMRGDTDGNGSYTIGDGVQILERQFTGRQAFTSNCEDAGDVDDNGFFTIGDAIWLFNYLFASGRPPGMPYGTCGADPTPGTTMGCAGYPAGNCP
ncbi:MAG: hypothetical protein JXP34_06790 [Planctomycetes bacterium]|nr:hypothetical protein [Planctomycetota bacterium]